VITANSTECEVGSPALKRLEFYSTASSFSVVLKNLNFRALEIITQDVGKGVGKDVGLSVTINETQEKIIACIEQNPTIPRLSFSMLRTSSLSEKYLSQSPYRSDSNFSRSAFQSLAGMEVRPFSTPVRYLCAVSCAEIEAESNILLIRFA